MIKFLSFFLQISLSTDFPETKNLRGGVFTWPSALAYSRNMWKWVKIPKITFDYSDISISNITKHLISDKINVNLTQAIQDFLYDLFEEKENVKLKTQNNNNLFAFFNNSSINDFTNIYSTDKNSICNEKEFPNAYLLKMNSNKIDCKFANDLFGQLFSYGFIIMPLFIIFILTIIFYFIFCFGRCFCLKPQRRTDPNRIEIILFSISAFFVLITIIICISAYSDLSVILKYVFEKEFQNDIEGFCENVNPSVNEGLNNFVNSIIPSILNISSETLGVIDNSLPNLVSVLNETSKNMHSFSKIMKDIQKFGSSSTSSLKNYENSYKQCASSQNLNMSSTCPQEISFLSQINFGHIANIVDILSFILNVIKEVIDVSSSVDERKHVITKSVDDIDESIHKFANVTIFDNCDFSDFFEPINKVPSFVLPLINTMFIIISLVMIIILIIQSIAFWTKGNFARCSSACCFPCFLCTTFHFVVGSIPTIMCFIIIFCNILYDQGDDILDIILKDIINEEKIIEFGNVNMSSFTKGVIGPFHLESVQLQKIEFVKNLIDAKLDTPASKVISFHQLPFKSIAEMVEKTVLNAERSIQLDKLIVDPVNNAIDSAFENLPDLKLDKIAKTDEMKSQLSEIRNSISCCDTQFNSLYEGYTDFFNSFDLKIKTYAELRNNVDQQLHNVPKSVAQLGSDLFGGILKKLGGTFASSFRGVEPALDAFEFDWAIGGFNILRVNLLHRFMSSMMCLSITAHLYLFGMVAMSMILWFRRRGMSKEEMNSETSDNSLYSELIN